MRRIVTAATSLCLLLGGHAAACAAPRATRRRSPSTTPARLRAAGVFGGSYPITEDWHDWSSLALGCAPLVNDTDPDGDPLSVELVGQPAHGEAR